MLPKILNTPCYPRALEGAAFDALRELAAQDNQRIYVIGGYVRDFLLGKTSKDIDIVTVGSGIHLARQFAQRIGAADVTVYENFGTALVKTPKVDIEFVGARRESYRKHSRKPIVENGSLYDDQLRRDFSINALSLGLHPDEYGQLFDPFGGQQDLEQGIIRTPADPQRTFSEDPLRMLRAIRFATRLDFEIAPETWQSIIEQHDRIRIVSMERVADELNKLLMARKPSRGFIMLFKTGLLRRIFPEMVKLHGVDTINGISHKDNFYHTLKVLDNVCTMSDDLWLRWAAVLHDIAKPQTRRFDPQAGWTFHGHEDRGARMVPGIFSRLRLPMNDKMKFVRKMVQLHLRPIALVDDGVSDSAIRRLIVDAGDDLESLMTLCRADITTRDAGRMQRYLRNFDKVEARIEEVEARDRLRNWQPPVSGEMIMAHFGLRPGPMVGQIKNAVREAILEGEIPNDPEAAFQYMVDTGNRLLTSSEDSPGILRNEADGQYPVEP